MSKIKWFIFPMIKSNTENGYPINIPQSFHCYNVISYLNCGSTSVIFVVEDQCNHQKYCAKIMSKIDISCKKIEKSVFNEVKVLQSINHPNIISMREFFEFKNANEEEYYVIIMEYCSKGDLLSYATNVGFSCEAQKKKIINGFLKATKYLHKNGVAHGDIKSENILLDENLNPKLCDFGYCKISLKAGNESKNGTIYYGAPELFVEGEFDTQKTDIYSIGITLYTISELQFPYKDGDQEYVINQITSGNLSFRDGIDTKLKSLVKRCTSFDPKLRPSIDDILNDEYLIYNENEIIKNNEICQKEVISEFSKLNKCEDPINDSYEVLPN
ncbi:hypothetical protein M9Y10_030826 [Tritrichomonas musculus]|uniref:Protein kinase domain-containing protein n=1 Tax=Tritrichomonas musculus TaxID=1915356 RepID=A0ABR2H3V9_9EUKA